MCELFLLTSNILTVNFITVYVITACTTEVKILYGKRLLIAKVFNPLECQTSMWLTMCCWYNVTRKRSHWRTLSSWSGVLLKNSGVGFLSDQLTLYLRRGTRGGYKHSGTCPGEADAHKGLGNPGLLGQKRREENLTQISKVAARKH